MPPRKRCARRELHVVAVGCLPGEAALPVRAPQHVITITGYRQPLSWLRGFGSLLLVGVEGTGAYALA